MSRMAFLDLPSITLPLDDSFSFKITNYRIVQEGQYVLYTIQVTLEPYKWTVERRYTEFAEFDRIRFPDQKKSFLPKKKMRGNLDMEFIEERKIELEKYMKTVMELEIWYQKQKNLHSLPFLVARFFDFHQYEIHSIVDDLSLRLGKVGDGWLDGSNSTPKYFEFTPIELYALGERMRLPEPTVTGATTHLVSFSSGSSAKADLANLVEFVHRVKSVKIRGSRGYVGSSDIVCNTLSISLAYCKNLLALWLADCEAIMVRDVSGVRETLRRLVLHYSMERCADFLLGHDDDASTYDGVDHCRPWSALQDVDFSFNQLEELDDSVRLLGGVINLSLAHNRLTCIGRYLSSLYALSFLDLSHNNISKLDNWHGRLGNVKTLVLAENHIDNLAGISRLFSLEHLDVSRNNLSTIESVTPIGRLPCLEILALEGNGVCSTVEYRTRILEVFTTRAYDVELDGKKADSRERNTIGVRLALRRAKVDREEQERQRRLREDDQISYLTSSASSHSLR